MKNSKNFSRKAFGFLAIVMSITAPFSVSTQAQQSPTINQTFTESSILQGEISTLSFSLENLPAGTDVSFSSTLPDDLVIASPANAISGCGIGDPGANNGRDNGIVTAAAGGSVISFSKNAEVEGDSCLVEVNVTSSILGVYENPAVTLFYDGGAGQAQSNTATLNVTGIGPIFSKSFSPDSIEFGGRTRLSFTIDNSQGGNLSQMSFSDNLPAGMLVANPANLTSTCPTFPVSTLTAVANSDVISYSLFSATFAQDVCTIAVDVVVNAIGVVQNISEELITRPALSQTDNSSGKAIATVTVAGGQLELTEEFVGDPVNAGGTVDLVYVLQNTDRSHAATGIAFTDDLSAALSGLSAVAVTQNDCGGSLLTGSVIDFSGGSLDPESSCSMTVSLQVPAGAASGEYPNTTSAVSGSINGQSVTGTTASDSLFVAPIPILTKAFSEDLVTAGTTSIALEFNIENTSADFPATDVAFTDELTTFLPLPLVTDLPVFPNPPLTVCGSGTLTLVSLGTGGQGLSLTGGSLDESGSCSFTVVFTLPEGLPSGTYTNTTSAVTATVDGSTVTGPAATDSFVLVAPPALIKEFTNDPVMAGQIATLEFTLTNNSENAAATASLITFSDDLDGTVAGMVVFSDPVSPLPPVADVCGPGSELEFSPGNNLLTLNNGVLVPGETCSFSVDVLVPAGTASGSYPNSTSGVTAEIGGLSLLGPSASADLMVGGLVLGKAFTPSSALPGSSVDITFTITNLNDITATEIGFLDSLTGTLSGLVVSQPGDFPIPDVCGTGSSMTLINPGILLLQNGSVDNLGDCSFTISLDVPVTATAGVYSNSTGALSYKIAGIAQTGDPASAKLSIVTDALVLSKEFISDAVCPGESTILRFTMTNLLSQDIDTIAFTDDLEAALSNLTAEGLPISPCGGSAVLNNTVIEFSNGYLAAEDICSFDVEVTVDPSTPPGSVASNVTSVISGSSGGVAVSGPAATDEIPVECIEFSKAFAGDGTVTIGGTTQLSFTLHNTNASSGVSNLSFSDDLDAMIDGAVATGLPLQDVCGPGSLIDGTDLVSLVRASLLPAGSCTVTIDVVVPESTADDIYENITSELFWDGVAAAGPATAFLTVLPPADGDGDGVLDDVDVCLNTVIPEGVPTVRLNPNRYALVDDDTIFDVGGNKAQSTKSKKGKKAKPPEVFTIEDTAGCSCEQIIEAADLGNGHTKFGCSLGAMRDWVDFVNLPVN